MSRLDLMGPRSLDSDGCIRLANRGWHPRGPVTQQCWSRGNVVHVEQSALAAMGEPAEQVVLPSGHRPIVGRPADVLCHSRRVDFSVESAQVDDVVVVTASGELDAHSAPTLDAVLGPLTQRSSIQLVVDLSAVGFIDSTGLGVLVTTLKHVREVDGRLDVVVVAPRVLKVFTLTGLDVVIPIHTTVASALAR